MYKHNLKTVLKELNISQSELSKRTGIIKQTIYKYVNYKRTMTIDSLVVIAKALNVTTDHILGLDNSEKIEND